MSYKIALYYFLSGKPQGKQIFHIIRKALIQIIIAK